MRISFFNEMDTFAEAMELDSVDVINGVSADPRIGNFYNNPSFGYGGYCLPKDTKQLLSDYSVIPEKLISAIVDSNYSRKKYIANRIFALLQNSILSKNKLGTVGVFRANMKSGSDNYRNSAIKDIINILNEYGVKIIIFEPALVNEESIWGYKVFADLEEFKRLSDIIVANRYDICLENVREKVYTRDIFFRD